MGITAAEVTPSTFASHAGRSDTGPEGARGGRCRDSGSLSYSVRRALQSSGACAQVKRWSFTRWGAESQTVALQIAPLSGGGELRVLGTARSAGKPSVQTTRARLSSMRSRGDWAGKSERRSARSGCMLVDLVGGKYLEGNLRVLALRGRSCRGRSNGGRDRAIQHGHASLKRLTVVGTMLRARPLEERIAFRARVLRAHSALRLWPARPSRSRFLHSRNPRRPRVDAVEQDLPSNRSSLGLNAFLRDMCGAGQGE